VMRRQKFTQYKTFEVNFTYVKCIYIYIFKYIQYCARCTPQNRSTHYWKLSIQFSFALSAIYAFISALLFATTKLQSEIIVYRRVQIVFTIAISFALLTK